MSSKKKISLPVLKQQLDDLKSKFELMTNELQQTFGIDYSGHSNTYEVQIEQILDNLEKLEDRVDDVAHEYDDLNDRVSDLEYIIQKIKNV